MNKVSKASEASLIKYLSPTGLAAFKSNPKRFYLERIAKCCARMPQTQAMSVGSAFDAFVKSYIHERLIGPVKGTEYELEVMLKEQCSPEWVDWARDAGRKCFEAYKISGALASLCQDLSNALDGTIKMEKTCSRVVDGVPLLGKPDLYFEPAGCGQQAATVFILDWKVNGYCSSASPKRGYVVCRDGWLPDATRAFKHSRTHNMSHAGCVVGEFCGIKVNIAMPLESIDRAWAAQVATYAWLLGAEPGAELWAGIDQLACGTQGIRIASHRAVISESFQLSLLEDYKKAWSAMESLETFSEVTGIPLAELHSANAMKADPLMDAFGF